MKNKLEIMVKYNIQGKAKEENKELIHKFRNVLVNECGYKYEFQDNKHVFKKGNTLANPFQFKPSNWKSEITISIEGELVSGDIKVSTFGQLVNSREKEYWDKFHQELLKLLNSENIDVSALSASSKKASQINLVIMVFLTLLVIVFKCS